MCFEMEQYGTNDTAEGVQVSQHTLQRLSISASHRTQYQELLEIPSEKIPLSTSPFHVFICLSWRKKGFFRIL